MARPKSSPNSHPATRNKPGPIKFFDDGKVKRPGDLVMLRWTALNVLKHEGKLGEVHLVFCSDETVRALNNEFRHLDKTTDVLSFPWNSDENDLVEGPFLGEIYVSMPQVERQAPEYGATKRQELERVIVHGLLHLCGHDHATPTQRRKMRELEEHYLGRQLYAR